MSQAQVWEVIAALMVSWDYLNEQRRDATSDHQRADLDIRINSLQDLLARLRKVAKQGERPRTMGSV
jgi:hypothetical protein